MRHERSDSVTVGHAGPRLPWTAALGLLLAIFLLQTRLPAKHEAFRGPTTSQPLALSADGNLLAVANPDVVTEKLWPHSADLGV